MSKSPPVVVSAQQDSSSCLRATYSGEHALGAQEKAEFPLRALSK